MICIYSFYYVHTHWTSFTTTDNSTLYNISAIRTVAQYTILIYSNTFFFLLQCTSLNCPHNKMQSTSPKRPQKCMLSGQLEATGRKNWHESGNESCQYCTVAFPHSWPQCLARLIVSGGKDIVDTVKSEQHIRNILHTHTNRLWGADEFPPTLSHSTTFPHTVTLYSSSGLPMVDI